jgi:hypothetical protein
LGEEYAAWSILTGAGALCSVGVFSDEQATKAAARRIAKIFFIS